MIANLTLLTPDPSRADRLRARCHDRLARHRRAEAESAQPKHAGLERAIVGGVCVIYMSAVVLTAVQVLSGR